MNSHAKGGCIALTFAPSRFLDQVFVSIGADADFHHERVVEACDYIDRTVHHEREAADEHNMVAQALMPKQRSKSYGDRVQVRCTARFCNRPVVWF